jgi:hypothetical protein
VVVSGTPGATVVFTRAADNGVFDAMVWDVVMDPSW